jgi:hypothetical protein
MWLHCYSDIYFSQIAEKITRNIFPEFFFHLNINFFMKWVFVLILFSSKCLYCTFSVLLRYTDSGIFKLFLQHKQIYFYCLFTLCDDLVFMCICYLLWTVTFICYILYICLCCKKSLKIPESVYRRRTENVQ